MGKLLSNYLYDLAKKNKKKLMLNLKAHNKKLKTLGNNIITE